MKPNDRARLTTALRDHVGKIAADLRAKMRAPGDTRARAQQVHADEKVAEDFDVWTDLLSRRAAVLWVLKSVYVRVLEDRGLLTPGRLLDQEAQQLFERLAPHLGETAFLRWVYRDLASSHGGLPELFSPQPAEVALPSDELSRALIAFWRHRDADTGATWSFAEERFEGELMGDLYQELDPVVKDRFALCQTPDFVRAFILDRTLTPAIETFGADEVRLLDPACGSGHFLIDGLKRLVAATAAKHPDWERAMVVAHALERVVGIDLNDYACALARARLIMTTSELAGVTSLAEAARFHPHVYWADGLEQVERDEVKPSVQFSLFEKVEEKPRATLTRSDVRAALKKVFATKFHAVVANPPYITESDDERKAYHREKIGRTRRYLSAHREYSLGPLFVERALQLAIPGGCVGTITGNSFTKRDFGEPFIKQVLPRASLSLIVDLSQAVIPFHTTPTVLLFVRNQAPAGEPVRIVLGKQGEAGTPCDPATGLVWTSLVSHWMTPGYEDVFISVASWSQKVAGTHPWNLQGGGAAGIKQVIESRATCALKDIAADMGAAVLTRCDDVYLAAPGTYGARFTSDEVRPFVTGKQVRDWGWAADMEALFPYGAQPRLASSASMERWLWPYRAKLWLRKEPNGNHRELGLTWWEWSRFIRRRYADTLQIVFSNVASHNHFALLRNGVLCGSHAPTISLRSEYSESDYLSVLALLNSSLGCFWMKQVFYPKGSKTHDVDRDGTFPENNRYEYATTGLGRFPIPSGWRDERLVALSRALEGIVQERAALRPVSVIASPDALASAAHLSAVLDAASVRDDALQEQMICLQEEIDWVVYELFGVADRAHSIGISDLDWILRNASGVADEARPFRCREAAIPANLPDALHQLYLGRSVALRDNPAIGVLEAPVYKRLWRGAQGIFGRYDRTYAEKTRTALRRWISAAVEKSLELRGRPGTLDQIANALQSHPAVSAVVEVLEGRRDYSLQQVVAAVLAEEAIPNHPALLLTESGLIKLRAWEATWAQQRAEDREGRDLLLTPPREFVETDFLRPEWFRRRKGLNVPTERFIAFTEVPGRSGAGALYGWAGWTPLQRIKAILAIDEELEDGSVALVERIGLLDSAWRLLLDAAPEDASAAARLKAELQALVGPEGPSRELIEDWKKRFPPPTTRATRTKRAAAARVEDDSEDEESDES